jgi:lycopene beta-cyclase
VIEVLVVGGGPAGRALAAECGALGLATALVDPAPHAPWRATYGAWLDELPADLPPLAATARGRVVARTSHELERTYAVFDVPALRDHLDTRLAAAGVRIVTGRVVDVAHDPGAPGGRVVLLADGTRLAAPALVDAGGHRAPLSHRAARNPHDHAAHRAARDEPGDAARRHDPGRRPRVAAEQTAYGVVVDAATAGPVVGPGEALFMDWRPDHGEPDWPTFLYAIPLGGDAVLLEETSLARRPGLPLPVLRRRLHARLAHHGITAPPDARVERVRFPVDGHRHATPGVLGYGAAAPLVHPASGFSVADALRLAPLVADALATGGVPAAQRLVWSARAVAVHRLRRIGLEALLRMPPEAVPDFFETFFALPARHRDAYLSGRDDLAGHLAAMGALFGHADVRLRRRLVSPAFRRPAPALPTPL